MQTIIPLRLRDGIFQVSDSDRKIIFIRDTSFVDATQLALDIRGVKSIEGWKSSRLAQALYSCLEANNCNADFQHIAYFSHIFIHRSLAQHLIGWLNPKLNYAYCLLLQDIIINANKPIERNPPQVKYPQTHSFVLYLVDPQQKGLYNYYALECKTANFRHKSNQWL